MRKCEPGAGGRSPITGKAPDSVAGDGGDAASSVHLADAVASSVRDVEVATGIHRDAVGRLQSCPERRTIVARNELPIACDSGYMAGLAGASANLGYGEWPETEQHDEGGGESGRSPRMQAPWLVPVSWRPSARHRGSGGRAVTLWAAADVPHR